MLHIRKVVNYFAQYILKQKMTKNERLFFNIATHCRNCIVKQAGFKGGFR